VSDNDDEVVDATPGSPAVHTPQRVVGTHPADVPGATATVISVVSPRPRRNLFNSTFSWTSETSSRVELYAAPLDYSNETTNDKTKENRSEARH
jgi:hypothetical protein